MKYVTVSIVAPSICHEVMGLDAMILAFRMLNFKPTFSLSSFTFIKRLFSSFSGEGNGNPLQYSCLENPMDGAAWLATVHGVAKNRTQLSDFTVT